MLHLNWNLFIWCFDDYSDCTTDAAWKDILPDYHQDVFKDGLGTLRNVKVTIPIDSSAKSKFYRA